MNTDPLGDLAELMRLMGTRSDTPPTDIQPEHDWTHAGLRCQVIEGGYGARCGYVSAPEGSLAFDCHYGDEPLANMIVHGGITFSGPSRLDGTGWWIGWDTMHYGDTPDRWTLDAVIAETNRLAEQVAA